MLSKIVLMAGKDANRATPRDWYLAAALTLRDRIVNHWLQSNHATHSGGDKCVYYLSLEFLIGRLFTDALSQPRPHRRVPHCAGGFRRQLRGAEDHRARRRARQRRARPLAAASWRAWRRSASRRAATASATSTACSGSHLRRLAGGIPRAVAALRQPVGVRTTGDHLPRPLRRHAAARRGRRAAMAAGGDRRGGRYDTPIVGAGEHHVNALRLWSARAVDPMNIEVFNSGDHLGAMSEMARAEAISKFLYPSDETPRGASCGCGRNISSSRRRCRTSSTTTSRATATCACSTPTPRCSSTTPIRASWCRN